MSAFNNIRAYRRRRAGCSWSGSMLRRANPAAAAPQNELLYRNLCCGHRRLRRSGRAVSYSSHPFNFIEADR
jgi:hypothetical protein